MTRAKDISKIITDADFSGTIDVTNDIKFTTDRHKFVGGTGANLELGTYSSNNTSRDVHLEIDSAGRVGIGTSSPSNPFEVIGSVDSNIATFSTLGDGGGASNRGLSIAADTYGGSIRTVGSSVSMGFDVNGSERMRITSGGNVSVGGTNATARLNAIAANWPENALGVYSANIAGQTNFAGIAFFNQDTDSATGNVADIYTNPTGTLSLTSASNPAIQLKYGSSGISGGTAALTVDGSGNVGIGVSNPSTYDDGGDRLVIGRTDARSGMTIVSSTSTAGSIHFADGTGTSSYRGIIAYYHDNDSMRFYTSGASEKMRIDSSGNVGIGTSSPEDKLEVDGIINIKRLNQLSVLSTTATGVANFEFGFNKSGSTTRGMPNDTAFINMRQGYPIIIATQETERMRIDASGNVAIGQSDIRAQLSIGKAKSGTGVESVNLLSLEPTGTFAIGDTANINFNRGSTTTARISGYYGNDNVSYGELVFSTRRYTTDALNEGFRLDNRGRLLVGNTGYNIGQDGAYLQAAGSVFSRNTTSGATQVNFANPNGVVGSISTSGTSTSYNTSSDHRLKENVTADWDATTRLKQLNPVRFNFIADADTTVDGFLAHEVQSVVPEAITGTHNEVDDDGNPVYQGIDQSKLVPLLVKTIQELEARIVALETA